MRKKRLLITSLVVALAAAAPVAAVEIEVREDTRPAAATAEPSPTPAVETGSIEEPAAAVPTGSAFIGRGVRELIEAEEAAAEANSTAEPAPATTGDAPVVVQRSSDERDRDALKSFYEKRADAPLWVSEKGINAKAKLIGDLIKKGPDWGFEADAFEWPALKSEDDAGDNPSAADLAKAEMTISLTTMKYARYARGAAVNDAPKDLSSYLDRRPQVRNRDKLLEELAAAADPAAYLEAIHPQHPEFKRLHQAWLEARGGDGKKANKAKAAQLLANMQQWRWLPEDLGKFHVWMNVPEYTVRIVKDGEVIWTERATAGLVDKQTPIFSDVIERVTFKSKWRVPDSIKVKEVWPSLLRGGGMMRQHGLVLTKGEDGEAVDWRKINWAKADMNDYVLWQPPGPKNQLGLVKFSFPSKHRVYMHDTPDKYMFAWSRRAVSHGCMRIRNPLQMATLILGKDKGWERDRIDDLVKNGPEHNVIELDEKIPVHITYFTTRIDENGKITTFPDVYGHEKRVRQALGGDWKAIAKGSDHLAPLDQTRVPRVAVSNKRRALPDQTAGGLMGAIFGGGGF